MPVGASNWPKMVAHITCECNLASVSQMPSRIMETVRPPHRKGKRRPICNHPTACLYSPAGAWKAIPSVFSPSGHGPAVAFSPPPIPSGAAGAGLGAIHPGNSGTKTPQERWRRGTTYDSQARIGRLYQLVENPPAAAAAGSCPVICSGPRLAGCRRRTGTRRVPPGCAVARPDAPTHPCHSQLVKPD